MKIKILSWNVKGVNDAAKRKVIKAFIKMQRVDVVCLQETKFKEVSIGLIRSLGVGRFLDWAALRAEGASGGIVIFWDFHVLKLLAKEEVSSQRLVDSNSLLTTVLGFSWGFMVPLPMGLRNISRMSWEP